MKTEKKTTDSSAERKKIFERLSPQQKLEGLEKLNRFLYYFMPQKSKEFAAKVRKGNI
ncbi:MAG: hypothetical protein NTZ10_04375 [Candidatus Saganbacteria bacterium]|nr:hypothetical protein [Candidatus Saganbacteria bacterium]